MIKGMPIAVAYNTSTKNWIHFEVVDDRGFRRSPAAAPNITISNPSGDELVSATAMTIISTYEQLTEGYLFYDSQTADFTVGETLTGGTSAATALIVDIWDGEPKTPGTSTAPYGLLQLKKIDGTFQDNETVTDSGSGSATADGAAFTCEYIYSLDTSTTSSYPVAQNYVAKVEYNIVGADTNNQAYVRWIYFDVVHYPMAYPVVTSSDVIDKYPALSSSLPNEWSNWMPAVKQAHAKLVRTIHRQGLQAAHFVKRDQEMWDILIVWTRAEIARALGQPQEMIDYWEKEAQEAWASRGEFTFDSDEDEEIDSDVKVISSRCTR